MQSKSSLQQDIDDDSIHINNEDIVLLSVGDTLVESRNQQQFAITIYDKISRENTCNMVCSPIGIEILYSILRKGAKGVTYNELDKVLGLTGNDADTIAQDLSLPSVQSATTINMANLIVAEKKFHIKSAYKSNIKKQIRAEIWSRVFNIETLTDINRWIEEKTHGLIHNGIDDLDGSMYGVNTIYFNGQWEDVFDESVTRPTVFTNLNGKKVKVSMMSQRSHVPYMKTKSFQVLALPYEQRKCNQAKYINYSLYVFLPLPGKDFFSIKEYLQRNSLSSIRQEMADYGERYFNFSRPIVNIKIPRLEIMQEIDITSVMKALGVQTVFNANADFSNISDDSIYINQSRQKAVIRIDECGTEAAAKTDIVALTGPYETPDKSTEAFFHANRPFIYMVVCDDNNTILFIGHYTNGMIKNGDTWVTDDDVADADVLSYTMDKNSQTQEYSVWQAKEQDSNTIYSVVEQMPQFPGGMQELIAFVNKNLLYPDDALQTRTEGVVVISCVIEADGIVSNIQVLKSISPSMDKEAERIVKSMPRWNPGRKNGKNVRVRYSIPIAFRLKSKG